MTAIHCVIGILTASPPHTRFLPHKSNIISVMHKCIINSAPLN